MSKDELLVIQRAQKGDTLAFAHLHDRYYQDIYQYFFYRIWDVDTAQNLTADLFIRMAERISLYKLDSMKFFAWLTLLARSLLMEELLRRGMNFDQAMDGSPNWSNNPTPNEPVVPADRLKLALAQLPGEEREVLIGKCIEHRSNREVAHEIGRSAAAVRILQMQGLARLRELLPTDGTP